MHSAGAVGFFLRIVLHKFVDQSDVLCIVQCVVPANVYPHFDVQMAHTESRGDDSEHVQLMAQWLWWTYPNIVLVPIPPNANTFGLVLLCFVLLWCICMYLIYTLFIYIIKHVLNIFNNKLTNELDGIVICNKIMDLSYNLAGIMQV